MGFAINYRTTLPVEQAVIDAITTDLESTNQQRTWLSCEPVFLIKDDDGHLVGSSKPNFRPHSDDIQDAVQSDMPDGTVKDVLDILVSISRIHNVDWIIGNDFMPCMGEIRGGIATAELLEAVSAFDSVGGLLNDDDDEEEFLDEEDLDALMEAYDPK